MADYATNFRNLLQQYVRDYETVDRINNPETWNRFLQDYREYIRSHFSTVNIGTADQVYRKARAYLRMFP